MGSQNDSSHKTDFVGSLDVYIHSAREIHNICIYQKQDVYAKVYLTSDPGNSKSSKIINGGGRNPVFDENVRLDVKTIDSSFKCEIWMLSRVRNYLEDQLLDLQECHLAYFQPMKAVTVSTPSLRMIDIAVNFTDGMFKGIYNGKSYHKADIPLVLNKAWDAGVDRIIVTGGSLEESKEALAIAETDGRLFCTVGVHPTRCNEFEESGDPDGHYKSLLSLAKEGIEKGKVVAIGECGLDYDRLHFCSSDVQKKYFERQFDLAECLKLPMFLHMRAAAKDFCDILHRNVGRFSVGVAHSFTGSKEDSERLLLFDSLFIGINGCSLKTVENLDVVRSIPTERMMIETDSPYCEIRSTHAGIQYVKSVWPSKKKEKYENDSSQSIVKGRNEPCLVRQVLEVVAGCKDIDITQLSKVVYHNTCSVFFPQDLDSAADALLDQAGPS